ncbi:interleukin-27 subunit beta [Rhinatrema bivittatum]|uniref:interleukin-27 subunit beta n=1 Tax=Rhinatrema bivittatum TaxID=194408 RepID=UPI00112677EE|nr:interleukin-27 subunit beta [Rhinatrema bivittatum]XP_029470087.1 interleukin-27 subunit beta [Rhinatrema bivittatum]
MTEMKVFILACVLAACTISHSSWAGREMDAEEAPPMKPGIKCWAVSYPESVHCTWKLEPAPHLNTSFITTYRQMMETEEEANECIQSLAEANSCTISDFQIFSMIPYILNVTAVNPLGSVTHLHPFIVEQIIKPDPPENLRVSSIPGQRKKLLLKWDPPKSWPFPQYFPLKYLIRYQRAGSSTFRKIGPYEQTSFNLTGIRPSTLYSVQVSAKECMDYGKQSAWSPAAAGKAWDKR